MFLYEHVVLCIIKFENALRSTELILYVYIILVVLLLVFSCYGLLYSFMFMDQYQVMLEKSEIILFF